MSGASATQEQTAIRLLKNRGRPLRSGELVEAGVHYQTVSRMERAGKVVRMCRGIYQLPDEHLDDLAEVALRVPRGVVCLVSALIFHEMTLQMPHKVWMAVGQSAHRPKVDFPFVQFERFNDQALSLGVEKHVVDGVEVSIFSPAKTVVDCFRYRRKIGLDIALEGLRNAIEGGETKPAAIVDLAIKLRIWTVIRPYLEALVADV